VKKEQAPEIFRAHANTMVVREVVEGDRDETTRYFDSQLLKAIVRGQRICVERSKNRLCKNKLINRRSRADWLCQRQAILRQALQETFYMIQRGPVQLRIKFIEGMQDLISHFVVSAMCGSQNGLR
jgi:hypothetical protein